ncbi:MAG TPA: endonuclease/exonuclease/phosphatase family protein, partial [Candidatus Polarisedimenticolia bacterium]|nr:endonuclease/exonuclease/phosphatase family protein [Candidatus Polarisedimenticolia bacterium]
PQILAGDFNSLHAWPMLQSLTAERNGGPPAFRDAWLEAKQRVGTGQTFHWSFGLPGPRIDYILVRPRCVIASVTTAGAPTGGVFPSDHFALIADLDLSRRDGGI